MTNLHVNSGSHTLTGAGRVKSGIPFEDLQVPSRVLNTRRPVEGSQAYMGRSNRHRFRLGPGLLQDPVQVREVYRLDEEVVEADQGGRIKPGRPLIQAGGMWQRLR